VPPNPKPTSALQERDVELAKTRGVGEHIDGHNLPAHDREPEHDARPSTGSPHQRRSPIDERPLCGAGTARQRGGHRCGTPDVPGSALSDRCAVGLEYDLGVEQCQERVEVTTARGGEEGLDNCQGKARDAMEFYHKVLVGKLDLYAADEKGAPRPAGPGDRIMHARLEADGVIVIASDGHPRYPAQVGENMGIVLGGTDKAGLTTAFNALAEGGQVKMPLTKTPWGAEAGWLVDKFGISSNVDIDNA
jgi:PhnB protein